jgi:2-phosphosulfolactate phosphatase
VKLTVFFTPLGMGSQLVTGKPVVVIDVLRSTTAIVAALANGARAVVPAASGDDALRLAQNLERGNVLLAGERGSLRIEGFALGNSPLEMSREAVAGKTIVMSTTNGTPAMLAAESGSPVLIAAITNFSAVVARARDEFENRGEIVILCSGRRGMFSLDDAYVAGRFAAELIPGRERRKAELNDAAIATFQLARYYGEKWRRAVLSSAAARDLKQLGFKKDIDAATEVDSHTVVPVYSERLITIPD